MDWNLSVTKWTWGCRGKAKVDVNFFSIFFWGCKICFEIISGLFEKPKIFHPDPQDFGKKSRDRNTKNLGDTGISIPKNPVLKSPLFKVTWNCYEFFCPDAQNLIRVNRKTVNKRAHLSTHWPCIILNFRLIIIVQL